MPGDEELFEFLEDLESQATALHDAERRVEVADRARSEYRQVTLAARLMASVGEVVHLHTQGPGVLSGRLARVGAGWCALETAGADWTVATAAVMTVRGACSRAVPEMAWRRTDRLGLGSALRELADDQSRCQVHLVDGTHWEGTLGRIGSDFVELVHGGQVMLLALSHVAGISATSVVR